VQHGHDERERRRVDAVLELAVREGVERGGRRVARVGERLEQGGDEARDLRVLDDGTDGGERGVRTLFDARVRGGERVLRERGHDLRQRGGELLGRAVGHTAEQLYRSVLGAPLVFLERAQQRGQHHLDALRRKLGHDLLRRHHGGVAHWARGVGHGREQQRQDGDHVRLEEPTERARKALVGLQRALA